MEGRRMKGKKWMMRWAWAGMAGAALWASPALAQPAKQAAPAAATIPANKTIATVNGEAIPYSRLEPLLRETGPMRPEMSQAVLREVYREALGMVIDDLLM